MIILESLSNCASIIKRETELLSNMKFWQTFRGAKQLAQLPPRSIGSVILVEYLKMKSDDVFLG